MPSHVPIFFCPILNIQKQNYLYQKNNHESKVKFVLS
jgi:hypothetical protein